MSKAETRPVRGYALSIAPLRPGWRPIAGYLDGSPVLTPETVIANDNGKRRFRFVEQVGGKTTPRQTRMVGDVFCADHNTVEFVRAAINEKLIRDQDAEINRNTFRIFGSTVTQVGEETVLKLAAERLSDGETVTFDFTLESPKAERQEAGEAHFINCAIASVFATSTMLR
ncbi:hypothetical protein [Ensifer canadensis]